MRTSLLEVNSAEHCQHDKIPRDIERASEKRFRFWTDGVFDVELVFDANCKVLPHEEVTCSAVAFPPHFLLLHATSAQTNDDGLQGPMCPVLFPYRSHWSDGKLSGSTLNVRLPPLLLSIEEANAARKGGVGIVSSMIACNASLE